MKETELTDTTGETVELVMRQAETSDARAIMGLLQTIASESDFVTLGLAGLDNYEQQVQSISLYQELDAALQLVVEIDGQLVGMATLLPSFDPQQQHCAELGVCLVKEYWGLGIGSYLMEALLDFATNHPQLRYLFLEVIADNTRAIQLYQKFDFTTCGTFHERVRVNHQYYDTILMERRIA